MADLPEMLEVASGDPDAVRDCYAERGWGDGLPLVAPTPERVDAERMVRARRLTDSGFTAGRFCSTVVD